MSGEDWKWTLACTSFLAALVLLLYLRARRHSKFQHEHIDRKLGIVHQAVGEVKTAVEGSRLEAAIETKERRAETRYLTAVVEGARKDSAAAAQGLRTAQLASDEAASLRGDKAKESLKGFQLSIWQQFAEFLKSKFNHTKEPQAPPSGGRAEELWDIEHEKRPNSPPE